MSGITAVNLAAASTISGGDPQVQQHLIDGLYLIHVLQVYTSSMMALAVWDWIVCAPKEWRRIWKKEWSVMKCLYLWTRYYGIACFAINLWLFNAEFTIEACKALHHLTTATCMWVILGSEAIVAIRTYTFYGKRLWVGILVITMLLGETAFLLYVAIRTVHQITPLIGERGPCITGDKPGEHIVSGFWLAPVAFYVVCTALIIARALILRGGGVRSSLVSIFLREGIFYLIAIAAVNIFNAAFIIQNGNPDLRSINCYWALVLSHVLCSRLVLNHGSQTNMSTSLTSSEDHPSFSVSSSRIPNFSIPLKKYRGTTGMRSHDANSDEVFEGVKVQIHVEREAEDGRTG